MVDKKQLPDSVKVRHILVSTHQQQEQGGALMRVREDSAARKRLDSAIALINSGSNFDSVVLNILMTRVVKIKEVYMIILPQAEWLKNLTILFYRKNR